MELLPLDSEDDTAQQQEPDETSVYGGSERRRRQRRVTADRREMMRFEAKSDRRNGQDRRRVQALWDGRNF